MTLSLILLNILSMLTIVFLVRKEGVTPPTRKLKIVFNHFYIEPSDDGDITTKFLPMMHLFILRNYLTLISIERMKSLMQDQE